MLPKIKYFITADIVTIDQLTNKLSATGLFDSFLNFLYPAETPKFSILIGFCEVYKETEIIVEIVSPENNILFKIETLCSFSENDNFSSNLVNIEKIPLPKVGKYTVNIKAKESQELIGEYYFNAVYPPSRTFTPEEIQQIINDDTLTKSAKIGLHCSLCNEEHKFELNLDKNKPISEGFLQFPESDKYECCGNIFDLTGLRSQIYLNFGKKII